MRLQLFALPIAELPRALLVHGAVMVVAFGVAAFLVWKWPRAVRRFFVGLHHLGSNRTASLLLVCVTAWLLSGLVALFGGAPQPSVHDEFSNLLAADTFASGQATNPTHPLWLHFETIHVLSQPSYQSKYPPGQGLLLAAGQVVVGEPYLAVWLATGIAAGAVYWMLQAWLPARWALAGGLLTALHAGITVYWGTSYAGGQLALIGGALLYGGLGRCRRSPNVSAGVTMGLGLAVLANSRPAEGLLVSLPAAALLAWWGLRRVRNLPTMSRVFVTAAAVLVPCAAAMAYYNWRVTGSAWNLPYQEHSRQYMAAPIFFWESVPQTPRYNHLELRSFYAEWEFEQYERQTTWAGYVRGRIKRFLWIALFYTPPALILFWLGIPGIVRDGQIHWALGLLAFVGFALFFWIWLWPHYLAPCACLIMMVIMAGFRRVYTWRIGHWSLGRWLVAGSLLAQASMVLLIVGLSLFARDSGWNDQRARTLTQLQKAPGQHLVLVAYRPSHNLHHEWVYNAADIDGAKVVWARILDGRSNQRLLAYFRHRKIWYLKADTPVPNPVRLTQEMRDRLCTVNGQMSWRRSGGETTSIFDM